MPEAGIGKLVFGLRRISSFIVELENGKLLRKPILADCRSCSLSNIVCEEIEYPCTFLLRKCGKREGEKDCETCKRLTECFDEKPCCWDCPYLMNCLEIAKERDGEEYVRIIYGCCWDEFETAVKMLAENEEK